MATKKKDPPALDPDTDRIATLSDFQPSFATERTSPIPQQLTPSARIRGMGWAPDPHDTRDRSAKSMFGAHATIPAEASLEQHVQGVRDQTITSSCVGQAIARAIDVRLRQMGVSGAPYPSAQAIYAVARGVDRLTNAEQLTDIGCQPRMAMKGAREFGIPREADWPFDEAKINDELPWDVLQAGSQFLLTGYYRVDTMGRERVLDVCHAISKGYPVILGVQVDQAFQDATGRAPLQRPIGSFGGHMLCLVGYRTQPDGAILLRGVNSWGEAWGDRGLFWASEAWLTDAGAGDLYVLTVSG